MIKQRGNFILLHTKPVKKTVKIIYFAILSIPILLAVLNLSITAYYNKSPCVVTEYTGSNFAEFFCYDDGTQVNSENIGYSDFNGNFYIKIGKTNHIIPVDEDGMLYFLKMCKKIDETSYFTVRKYKNQHFNDTFSNHDFDVFYKVDVLNNNVVMLYKSNQSMYIIDGDDDNVILFNTENLTIESFNLKTNESIVLQEVDKQNVYSFTIENDNIIMNQNHRLNEPVVLIMIFFF